jgi:hypothetical protein
MKRLILMLFAMAFVVSIAYAGFDGSKGPSAQKAFDGRWDESKCFENDHGHPGPYMGQCTEICPGFKPHDRCGFGCDCGCKDQCDCGKKHFGIDNCFVFEKCDKCGKTVCDGICDECGEKCDVYEYCPVCGVKYPVCQADGICDKCGRDCYCIEKCTKCGHNHYFNGYCDECADRCYYGRCCQNYDHADHAPCGDKCTDECDSCMGVDSCDYADGGPVVFVKYLGDEDSNGSYADQIPLIYPLEDGASTDEASMD